MSGFCGIIIVSNNQRNFSYDADDKDALPYILSDHFTVHLQQIVPAQVCLLADNCTVFDDFERQLKDSLESQFHARYVWILWNLNIKWMFDQKFKKITVRKKASKNFYT